MTKTEWKIAGVVLAMLACGAGLLAHGVGLDNSASQVGAMRSWRQDGAEHLSLIFNGAMHTLDARGARVARQPLGELLMSEEPSDMDWARAEDGRMQAWFFEDTAPRIVRCDLDPASRRLVGCAQVMSGAHLKAHPRSRAVHMAVDAAGRRVFIADAKGHQVRALGFDGKVQAASPEGTLFFPNRVRLAGNGLLVVADNDNRRLAWIDVSGAKPSLALKRTLPASAHPAGRPGHSKVTDVAFREDGKGNVAALWLIAMRQGQVQGDVLVYGPDLAPVGRAALGGDDPMVIEVLGNEAVVADFNGVDLYRVGAQGEALGPFGDAALRSELAAQRSAAGKGRPWTVAGWIVMGATFVIGFVLAWKFGEKPVRAAAGLKLPATAAQLDAGQSVRLEMAPGHVRQMKMALWAGPLAALAGIGLIVFFSHELPPALLEKAFWKPWAVGVAVLAASAVSLWRAFSFAPLSLVVSADSLELRARGKLLAAAPLGEVLVSGDALLVGRRVVRFRQSQATGRARWFYDEEQLTHYLLARLPAANQVSQAAFMGAAVSRAPAAYKVLFAAAILAVVALTVVVVKFR